MGTAEVVKADSRNLPYPDDSVDLIITSPPYFALRSYQDGGEHYAGQIGDEPTPAEFVASLLEVTRECMRVLKPTGSLWVNLGDKYSRGSRPLAQPDQFRATADITYDDPKYVKSFTPENSGIAGKSLMGIPWRYAIACIDDLGLILRAEVIWSKPNGLPESVTDRVRRSHEQWFHFTLQPRYFSAVDEIREPHLEPDRKRADTFGGVSAAAGVRHAGPSTYTGPTNPLGKLPGSVWTIPTEPLKVPAELGIDHFAAFPTEWSRRIINGFSPAGLCDECGEGRRPVVHKAKTPDRPGRVQEREVDAMTDAHGQDGRAGSRHTTEAIVTGTTAMVAKALGRHGISVDMSADYCRLAEWRTNDENQLERVRNMQVYGVRKPTKTQIREHEARVAGALSAASATVTDTPTRETQP